MGTHRPMEQGAPDLAAVCSALREAGIAALALRPAPSPLTEPDPLDRRLQILIRKADFEAAVRVLEPMSWRYSWVRSGLMRLMPMAYYWWDGGTHLEVYWAIPAAPLPPVALTGMTAALWRSAAATPGGCTRPGPAALLVHLAVQACRPGSGHEGEWKSFLELRTSLDDLTEVHQVARRVNVSRGVRRALAAADARAGRPTPGAVFDGLLGIIWRLAQAVQARARPSRLRRLLAGMPVLGDATMRCRIAGVEVRAGAGVFVPTPDADIFVEMAVERLQTVAKPNIVEVGTGCGAIALALANARPDAEVHATELSGEAVRWARQNARRLALERVDFSTGSLLDPLGVGFHGSVDIIIANLPFYPASGYAAIGSVPRGTIQGAGADGLDLLRRLAREAITFLRPGGSLLLQMFAWQWELLSVELAQMGYLPETPRTSGPFAICPAVLGGRPPADSTAGRGD